MIPPHLLTNARGVRVAASWLADVLSLPDVSDGDTCRGRIERIIGVDDDHAEIIKRDLPKGRKIRLHDGGIGLNCPERPKDPEAWANAKIDFEEWTEYWLRSGLKITFEFFGFDSFGRSLGNLLILDAPLEMKMLPNAVQHMRDKRGWPAYVR